MLFKNSTKKFLRLLLSTAVCTVAVTALNHEVFAAPEGAIIVGGSALVTQSGQDTNISQTTDRAIIRWDSFDVEQTEKVKFHQPSSNSMTVNRIIDSKKSQIDGQITANGKVVIINQNGIAFGATSKVDVNSLVATSVDLDNDADFMAGGAIKFSKNGNQDAKISNAGKITAKEAGLVGLIAPHVENSGVIQARLGKVQLSSGDIHTIDFAGDGLIQVEVSDKVLSQTIKNTGTLTADGGSIIISAAQGRKTLESVITNQGLIQSGTVYADGKAFRKGNINITAPTQTAQKSKIVQDGTLVADGGRIEIFAKDISIGGSAKITTASSLGGGNILIGGAKQGVSSRPTAKTLMVSQGAIIDASAIHNGNGGEVILWSDDITSFNGQIFSKGGGLSGNGGFVEVSGKDRLNFNGIVDLTAPLGKTGTLLLDPTNITISAGLDNSVTGASPFTPTLDDGTSVLNVSTLTTALLSASVVVQTRATGSQAGNITVATPISWAGSNTLTLDAHNNIIINQAISGQNLTLIAGGDVQTNAALTGTGTLTISQANDGQSFGIGTGSVGTLNMTGTDLANLTNGWSQIIMGSATSTAAMDVRATTWNDNIELRSGTGIITIAGTQTLGANTLTLSSDGDIAVNSALTGTGTLNLRGSDITTGIGLGTGQLGQFQLDNTEISRITNGWANIVIGRTDGTGDINLGALTWNDNLTLQSSTGSIIVSGIQTLGANNLTFTTNGDPQINAALNSTGTLTFRGTTDATTIAVGDGQSGSLSLSNADLTNADNTWANIVIGRPTQSGAINIGGGFTLDDPLTIQSTTGTISVAATGMNMGGNILTIITDADPVINGNIAGTATFTLRQASNTVSMGLGNSQTGTVNLNSTELSRILNGWASIVFGLTTSTADINLGAHTWNDPLTLRTGSGIININGTQTMAANNLTIQTDSNLNIGAALTGTGALLITPNGNTSLGIGTGQAGTISLTDAELGNITNGWSSLTFGLITSNQTVNIGAYSWNDNVTIRNSSGLMTVAGTQTLGANSLTLSTDSNIAINAALTGTGTVTITPSGNTSLGIGTGQAGTISLTNIKLAQITNGWANIVLGSGASTQPVNVGAYSWNDSLTLRSGTGVITIAGAQTMSNNNLSIQTNANPVINANLTGTGVFTLRGFTNATSVSIGTGQTGTVNLDNTELGRLIDGWTRFDFGQTGSTGTINIGAYTWNDPIRILSNTGIISINGAQAMGANSFEIVTNANPAINSLISGTGTLTIRGSSNGTTIGLGDAQVGAVQLSNAELANLGSGFNNLVFGSTALTGTMNVGAYTWLNNTIFRSNTGVISVNGAQNSGSRSITYETNANLAINAALNGTGNLTIRGAATATTIGIGTGQTGTISLTDAELGLISNGWSNIIFGMGTGTGAINIGTYTWNGPVRVISNTGVISVNGIQNMGANALIYETNANLAINAALNGTGSLTIRGAATATTIGVNGASGTLALSTAEIANITDGWSNVTIGRSDMTGALSLASATWLNPTTFITNGNLSISGIQTSTETSGTSLVFVTQGGNFSNTAGASAINPGGGRYLIYAVSTPTTTLGGLTPTSSVFNQTYISLPPGSVGASGNVIIYTTSGNVLLLKIDNQTKIYGDAVPTLTYTYLGGLQGGGLLSDALTSATLTAAGALLTDAVGVTRAITGSFTTALGYTVNVTNGILSVAPATLTATVDNETREYGDANPAFTVTYTGFKNGETYLDIDTLATASTTATATTNAGTAIISASGAVADNYNFVYVNGTLTITKATLTATADNKTREYGDTNPAFTFNYTGFKNGETASVIDTLATGTTTATALTNVGTAVISGSGANDNNYNFVYADGTLTITKATLTATADNKTREYGDANPAFTVTYTGFKNSETDSVIDTLATASNPSNLFTNPSTSVISVSGANDNNYNFTYTNGVLTITKANLNVTADNKSREYGDANPALTYSFGAFKNGQTSAVLDSLPTISTLADTTTNVGSSAITLAGGLDDQYNYVFTNATLTITKATLNATADNKTREYGDANPAFTVTYTGFKNSETDSVIDTLATASNPSNLFTNAGTSTISVSGANDNNYNFVYVNGTLTITKATLNATADNKTREYGDANPAFTFNYTGFKNGETDSVIDTLATGTTTATALTNVGTAVISGSGANDNNYDFVYADGTLTITKATLTATADNKTREYGDTNPAFTVTYTGFKNSETDSVIDTLATASNPSNLFTNAGTSTISVSGANDNNYNFVYADGTLTITKAPLIVQIDDATRIEGAINPTFTYAVTSGLKNGDAPSVLSSVSLFTTADIFTPVGIYAINGAGGLATNYFVASYLPGNLTITSGALPIRALPSTVYFSNSNGTRADWMKWQDLIYYEDEGFVEQILFGRTTTKRKYRL